MQTYKLSFLADNVALSDSTLLMQSDLLNSSVLVVPRAQLDAADIKSMDTTLPHKGVYVLCGKKRLYVGKTNQGLGRIKQHDRTKDFWDVAVLFVSSAFDEETIAGLESEAIAYVQQHSDFVLENKQQPQHQYSHLGTQFNVQSFLQQFNAVLGFLGCNPVAAAQTERVALSAEEHTSKLQQQIDDLEADLKQQIAKYDEQVLKVEQKDQEVQSLEQRLAALEQENKQLRATVQQQQLPTLAPTSGAEHVFVLQGGKANMVQLAVDRYVVLRGAKINVNSTHKSLYRSTKSLYEVLRAHDIITCDNGEFSLQCDMSFATPSAAGSFVLGRSCQGTAEWRDEQGRSINDLHALAAQNQDPSSAEAGATTDAQLASSSAENTINSTSTDASVTCNAGVLEPQVLQPEIELLAASNELPVKHSLSEEVPEQLRGVFHLKHRQLKAQLVYKGPKQWILLQGSQVRGEVRKDRAVAGHDEVAKMFANEREKGTIVAQPDGTFKTVVDLPFRAVSTAAEFVLGSSKNGWEAWLDDKGAAIKPLKDLVDKFEGKAAQQEQDALSQ